MSDLKIASINDAPHKFKFTSQQKYLLDIAELKAEELTDGILLGLNKLNHRQTHKKDTYICSNAGLGKTHTINALAKQHGVSLLTINGSASMNALVTHIATAKYLAGDKVVTIFIDDCDIIFKNPDYLNVMKGALDLPHIARLSWNVNMSSQIKGLETSPNVNDKIKADALRSFQDTCSVGVSIPCNNINFIIASNRFLACSADNPVSLMKRYEAAVHDRVNYIPIEMTPEENWGWIGRLLINNDIFDLNNQQKQIILDWIYKNIKFMRSTSMRAVKDLAVIMINYPDSYLKRWEMTLRK